MKEVINVHEARTHLWRPLDRAHAGEEIVLAKAGKPCARLVPLEPPAKRRLGFLRAFRPDEGFFEPLPEDGLAAWEGRGK